MNREDTSRSFQIREMIPDDIELIASYWLDSDPVYLTAMGVDLTKLPSRESLTSMLATQIGLPYNQKSSLAVIVLIEDQPAGHCNVNQIAFADRANMHLHLWKAEHRRQGFGLRMVTAALPVFFDRLKLQEIWCEPYRFNPAPFRVLEQAGFEYVRTYKTIPGSLNFEQEVNQYLLTRHRFETLYNSSTHE